MCIQWPNDKPKRLYNSRTDNHLMLSNDYLKPLTHLSDIMIGEKKRKRFSSVCHRLRNDLRVLYIYIFYYFRNADKKIIIDVSHSYRLVHFSNLITIFLIKILRLQGVTQFRR